MFNRKLLDKIKNLLAFLVASNRSAHGELFPLLLQKTNVRHEQFNIEHLFDN
jgi:hypothetical protein